jgi:hypothetical protein
VQSIGSVGFPFDGDPRAANTLAAWDGTKWVLEPRRVSYDHEKAARDVETCGIPYASRYAAMLRASRWLPRDWFSR